jgi:exosortase
MQNFVFLGRIVASTKARLPAEHRWRQACKTFPDLMGSATTVKTSEVSGLLTAAGVGIVVALIGALYTDILLDLASEWWTEPEASYGILIPPFTLYLAYLNRRETLSLPRRPDVRGLWLVAVACLTLLTGRLASEFFLSRISFVVLLAGLAWTFWGWLRLRSIAFNMVLLMTMVPPPAVLYNIAAAPLQLLASKVATGLAQVCGVSVYRDGNIINLADITLGVAEACSGLRSLSALVVASLLLGFVEKLSLLGRLAIFLLSAPLAILVNVCRVTGTAILADSRPELAMGYYHAFSGWLVFVIGSGFLWLATKLVLRLSRVPS